MGDQDFLWVQLIYDPVSILLHSCCEDYDLVELGHLAQESSAVGSDQEVGFSTFTFVDVVDQCLVEVEH